MISRNLLFGFLLLLAFNSTKAQFLLNGGFEDTTIVVGDTIPTHWSVDYFGAAFTMDAHSGNQAVQIWNWYYYGKGWLVYGDAQSSTTGGGLPVPFNPDVLDGWYQYEYGDNDGGLDSAVCEIYVYSRQGFTGARDTIAHERIKLGPAVDYTDFHIPIHYTIPGILADTILIRFISSDSGMCAVAGNGVCLYLTVDDLEISTTTGLHQPLDAVPTVQAYPSPSANAFRILAQDPKYFPCTMEIFDLSGRIVFSESLLTADHPEIKPGLPAGNYIWKTTHLNGFSESGKIAIQ